MIMGMLIPCMMCTKRGCALYTGAHCPRQSTVISLRVSTIYFLFLWTVYSNMTLNLDFCPTGPENTFKNLHVYLCLKVGNRKNSFCVTQAQTRRTAWKGDLVASLLTLMLRGIGMWTTVECSKGCKKLSLSFSQMGIWRFGTLERSHLYVACGLEAVMLGRRGQRQLLCPPGRGHLPRAGGLRALWEGRASLAGTHIGPGLRLFQTARAALSRMLLLFSVGK